MCRTPRSALVSREAANLTQQQDEAGTKLGPDQLGSLDPGRINSDQPGSTRINPDRLKFEHNKRKGMFNKRKRILLRIYGLTVMKIKQSLLSCPVLSSRHFVFLVPGPRGSSLRCPVSSRVLGHTCCCHLRNMDGDEGKIQPDLGHLSIPITSLYVLCLEKGSFICPLFITLLIFELYRENKGRKKTQCLCPRTLLAYILTSHRRKESLLSVKHTKHST